MRFLIPLAVAALAVLAPASASASSAVFTGNSLVVTGAPGETNNFDIRPNDNDSGLLIQDRGQMPSDPGGRCTVYQWSVNTLDCVGSVASVTVNADDGNDKVYLVDGWPGQSSVTISGGDGDDELTAPFQIPTSIDGGNGTDEIQGSLKNDSLSGGPGNDTLDGLQGSDELRGGDGDDVLAGDHQSAPFADVIDGGAGYDQIKADWTAPLTESQPPVSVTLDGVANDGRSGEGDNVTSIEKLHVSLAVSFTAAGDAVDFESFNYPGPDPVRFIGSPGNDRVRAYDNHDTIDTGAGDDLIEAGNGNDVITGGPGRDTINAEAGSGSCNFLVCRTPIGNDMVYARDGEVDNIDCGVGTDTAIVDAIDVVAGCETVDKGPATGGPPGNTPPGNTPPGGNGNPGNPSAKKCKVPKVKAKTKLTTVQKAVKKAGCKAKVVKQKHKKIKKGLVIKVSPKAGKTLTANATVKVYVSRGKK
jgi:Ca2+-binding RTX toxin-like protein